MNEASKLRKILSPAELAWFSGDVLDIGCGDDPITPTCVRFDKEDGDASHASSYLSGRKFDCVFSSHCLEHLDSPEAVLQDWWSLVRPDGMLVVCVPDEDLYEQGALGRFNSEHKHTFTLCKRKSWSPVSVNVLDLVKSLDGGELVKAELQDIGYDRGKLLFGKGVRAVDQTTGDAMAQIMFVVRKRKP